jgi:FKBP-type peptidyl-prolyl cis-trans isomerase (trigger factor)
MPPFQSITRQTLKGKTVRFDVVVKSVSEPRLPELDEAFLASFGIDGVAWKRSVRKSRQHGA